MKCALIIGWLLALSSGWSEVVQLPGLRVHAETKLVEAAGHIALTNGILEFFAVEAGGRDYESLVTLTCRPSALKFALLLIGCPEGETNGAPLRLDIEWVTGGKTNQLPAEALLLDRRTGQAPARLPWIFSGSYFSLDLSGSNQVFTADLEQAHVALWWQPAALINVRATAGNPYRGDDEGYAVKSQRVPPVGTPITLSLRRRE